MKKRSGIDCPARTIREEDLQAAVVAALNDTWARKGKVIAALKENVRSVLNEDTEERLAAADKALRDKQAELLSAGKDIAKTEEIGDAIIRLREQKQEILTEMASNAELQEHMADLVDFLDSQTEAVTDYSDALVRRLIEKITVYDEKITVEYKSGLTIEVEI